MYPVTPVVVGFEDQETQLAKDQDQYLTLPALILSDGCVVSRWHLTWRERLRMLWSGSLYLTIQTFGAPLQPQLPSVEPPILMEVLEGHGLKKAQA